MLDKIEVGFAKQGYFVTFALTTRMENTIKKQFPKAQPISMLSIGYKDVEDTLEPYRTPITNYLLPLLTGLTTKELQEVGEIKIFHRATEKNYLNISNSYVEV